MRTGSTRSLDVRHESSQRHMTIISTHTGPRRTTMDLDQLCDHCGKETNDHMLIQLTRLGECRDYVIPSFCVCQATLKHVK